MSTINITFPDGSIKPFEAGISAHELATSISHKLAENAVAVKINNSVKELYTKLDVDCSVKFLTFDDSEGREVYWHSSSHLMAHAIQSIYPEAKFGVGPAIDTGFYYDFDINTKLTEEDLPIIEAKMLELASKGTCFVRKEISKDEAVKYFTEVGDNFKLEIIEGIDDSAAKISLYTEGEFTDLCTGPHLDLSSKIKFVKLLTVSGSYWRGDEKNKQLQRIYGVTFPKKKMLDEHLALLEEAKKRDHRKLGKQLDLFSIHEEAGPGLVYWHPKGARIRLAIEDFWRQAHLDNGYDLLYSPHVGKSWLWETSGHLASFSENMFANMKIDEQNYYVKPMNCPFHIMIYTSKRYSYRDLPLRWAELGTVYRYEKSGVLHGLMRVRGFTQDDAHIFCAQEQIEDEIKEVIRFARFMWNKFGFDKLKYYISTRPEKAQGNDDLWEKAERSLKNTLEAENLDYEIDEGGGAFYGPKIDIKVKDALNREWQMSTIQFDFNLPERFNLTYVGEDGKEHRPFMVHRALLGSIERFFGVLIEHYGGAFPAWLAPTQVTVAPVSLAFTDYAEEVTNKLKNAGIRVNLDLRNEKVGYKIRESETQKVPYMLILGEKEVESKSVSVRKHKEGDKGTLSTEEFILSLINEINNKI